MWPQNLSIGFHWLSTELIWFILFPANWCYFSGLGQCLVMGGILSMIRPPFTAVICSQHLTWMCMWTYRAAGHSSIWDTQWTYFQVLERWLRGSWEVWQEAAGSDNSNNFYGRLDPSYRLPRILCFLLNPSQGTSWASVFCNGFQRDYPG